MKNSQIALAALAAISSAHIVSAQTDVNLTGSSAFRSAASTAILNVFNASGNSLSGYAYNGTSFTGATYQIFVGNIAGMSNPVTVRTVWTGSAAGINAVSNQATVNVSVLPSNTAISSGGTSGASTASLVSVKADIGFADNLQSSTSFTANALAQEKVGIIPFAFVAGKDVIPAITNITHQQAKSLLNLGVVAASQFTGVSTDTQTLYAGGRDNGSGTRITTLAELGYGTQNGVVQYFPVAASITNNTVGQINIQTSNGNNGETSGGTLANYTRYSTAGASDIFNGTQDNPAFIIYVGESDSYAAVYGVGGGVTGGGAGNGRYLTYNGISAFGGKAVRPSTFVVTSGSNVITGLNAGATTGVIVGQVVSGPGVAGGSVITAVGATTVTLDKNATSSASTGTLQIGALLPNVVRSGAYPFWNYEQVNYLTSRVNSASVTEPIKSKGVFKNALVARVAGFDYGFSGLADDAAFTVLRGEDGGILSAK